MNSSGKRMFWAHEDGTKVWASADELSAELPARDRAGFRRVASGKDATYRGWAATAFVAPGSNDAATVGCSCPVIDNGHGRGYQNSGMWVVNSTCRVHGVGQ